MFDRIIREGSTEPLSFLLTQKDDQGIEQPFNITERFFIFVLADKNGRANRWDRTHDPNSFTIAPGGVVNRIVFHPSPETFRFALSPYKAYFWVRDGANPLSFPPDKEFIIGVLDSFGVLML